MGRRKLEMKRIEDKSSRQVTFSKRRNGLMKKARELSVLCDVDVTVIVFSNRGRLYDFCSGESLPKSLQRYQNHFEAEGSIANDDNGKEDLSSMYSNVQSCSELLDTVATHINEPDIDQLNVTDLVQLERQLDAALIQTRSQKNKLVAESMNALHERERLLREENEMLMKQIAELENSGNAGRGMVELGTLDNSYLTTPQWGTLRFL
ncbi:agamous-like MADS-box protein AGL27 [Impatiens glandulifera]|uniref:agamous-like MADS-box protein AGL27 n=1 Tax=Impatiens glandulifera TaxID=253017 RepID=UPI001FB143A9|nr:agamous-like MADS-box protein AGL27 [Impatiens glandulifera]